MTKFAHDAIVPNSNSSLGKKQQVAEMFNDIAFKYDFLNRFLSVGIDVSWRKKGIHQLKEIKPQQVLDVATGTADVALLTYKILQPQKIIGIDISEGMLNIGKKKIEEQNLQNFIQLQKGDSEKIDFNDNTFDAITVAFGVRNFENLEKGLQEMLRVLKPNGKLVIMECTQPKQFAFKGFYNIYMNIIAPGFGKMFAKNKQAYQYLNNSIQAFPEGKTFLNVMEKAGFNKTYLKTLSLGLCTIYCGSK
ncbi:MAG: demethylmenaquinone methyltransferase [Chitinophagaceae bacterium]|nr:bifunctional demethylmenaquinone methyltransferase/2-methoxy-6-polyprenyl-1,4-benzoquinol methylase UbiE [Chitinophagales bacterium]